MTNGRVSERTQRCSRRGPEARGLAAKQWTATTMAATVLVTRGRAGETGG